MSRGEGGKGRELRTWASNRSVEFFLVVLTKQAAGNIIQMAMPIVEPTSPMTNSIDGINIPIIKATNTIDTVMYLKRCSGM